MEGMTRRNSLIDSLRLRKNSAADSDHLKQWNKTMALLLPRNGLKVRVNFPDTILVDAEQKVVARYCTADAGYMCQRSVQRSTLSDVLVEFCANMFDDPRINPNLYVAVAVFQNRQTALLRRSDILHLMKQPADSEDAADGKPSGSDGEVGAADRGGATGIEGESAGASPKKGGAASASGAQETPGPSPLAEVQVLNLEEEDLFEKPFALQLYLPPSLDRRYVCVYSSNPHTGKVSFNMVVRQYSSRYTNTLDSIVQRTVDVAKNAFDEDPSSLLGGGDGHDRKMADHPRDMGFKSDVRRCLTSIVSFLERAKGQKLSGVVTEFVRGLEGRPWLINIHSAVFLRQTIKASIGIPAELTRTPKARNSAKKASSKSTSRPSSAGPKPKSGRVGVGSRPSSAKAKSGGKEGGASSTGKGFKIHSALRDNFDGSVAEALAQDIECLKEKLQTQSDVLHQTQSALRREVERRKAEQEMTTELKSELKTENEKLREENASLKSMAEDFERKHSTIEQEVVDLRTNQSSKQDMLQERLTSLESARDQYMESSKNLSNEKTAIEKRFKDQEKLVAELRSRLEEEKETVAAVRVQLVALRKRVLDTEAKNKEYEIKISNYSKTNAKSMRRMVATEDPLQMAMRAEEVMNSLKAQDFILDYEPGYEDEKENEDVQVIRKKISEVLCDNFESLLEIYNFYSQLGEINRQGNMLLLNTSQFTKFARDIKFFDNKPSGGTMAGAGDSSEDKCTIEQVDIIFTRIVSKDDTNTKVTFTGFLEGICRLAYAKHGTALMALITKEDKSTPEERQKKLDMQTDILMSFVGNMLEKARYNKLGGLSISKQKTQWRKALHRSLKTTTRATSALTSGKKS